MATVKVIVQLKVQYGGILHKTGSAAPQKQLQWHAAECSGGRCMGVPSSLRAAHIEAGPCHPFRGAAWCLPLALQEGSNHTWNPQQAGWTDLHLSVTEAKDRSWQ